jgi:hypothetical protein
MYHISTARMVLCYDGMWHYIARNLLTPMVVVSTEGITSYHTPHAVKVSGVEKYATETKNYIFEYIKDIPHMLGQTKKKSRWLNENIKRIFND